MFSPPRLGPAEPRAPVVSGGSGSVPGLARSTGHLPARLCPPCPTLRPFPPRPPPTLGTETPRFSSKASAQRRPETAGNGAAGPQPSWEPETRGRRGSFLLPRAARRERRAAPVSQPRRGGPEIPPERGPGTERRRPNRPRRSSRVLPAPRGQFGGTEREIPEAGGRAAARGGHLSAPSTLDPASLAGSSRPGEAGGRLRRNSP